MDICIKVYVSLREINKYCGNDLKRPRFYWPHGLHVHTQSWPSGFSASPSPSQTCMKCVTVSMRNYNFTSKRTAVYSNQVWVTWPGYTDSSYSKLYVKYDRSFIKVLELQNKEVHKNTSARVKTSGKQVTVSRESTVNRPQILFLAFGW